MRFYNQSEKRLWHKSIFLSYKWQYCVVFIFLPIVLNIIYAIIQRSKGVSSTTFASFNAVPVNQISKVSASEQLTVGLLVILAFAQVVLLIFLCVKIPKFFIKSGAIILGFFSIFNFFAISLVASVIVMIIQAAKHGDTTQQNNLTLIVGSSLQVASYIFIIWYLFRFCDSVRKNILKVFCSPGAKSPFKKSLSKQSNKLTNYMSSTKMNNTLKVIELKNNRKINIHSHASDPSSRNKQYTIHADPSTPRTVMKLSVKKVLIIVSVFATCITIFSVFLILVNNGSTNGNSTSNNQDTLNDLYKNYGIYGRILFIVLVCALAPIVEESATRHGIISVMNFKRSPAGNLIGPTLTRFKDWRKILYLGFTGCLSAYYFANMHILFAPYAQIKQYIAIACILVIIYITVNFVVGYTIFAHSVFNCGILISGFFHVKGH